MCCPEHCCDVSFLVVMFSGTYVNLVLMQTVDQMRQRKLNRMILQSDQHQLTEKHSIPKLGPISLSLLKIQRFSFQQVTRLYRLSKIRLKTLLLWTKKRKNKQKLNFTRKSLLTHSIRRLSFTTKDLDQWCKTLK